jgi:hypothetical protein
VVLLFPDTNGRLDDFRGFLQRCAGFLSTRSAWTVRVAFAPQFRSLSKQYEEAFRQELATPIPNHVNPLRTYFEQRRLVSAKLSDVGDDQEYQEARFAYGASRFQVLYRRWVKEGDAAFDVVFSTVLAGAIAAGAGRLECAVLPLSYRHLSPLVDGTHPLARGAEEVDDGSARPQPSVGWLDRITAIADENAASTEDSTAEGVAP